MPQPQLGAAPMQAALNAFAECGGNASQAARNLGLPRTTFETRLARARQAGLKPAAPLSDPDDPSALKAELKRLRGEALTHAAIERRVLQLAADIARTQPPAWMLRAPQPDAPGVPTLFVSDLHWGEVVNPSQISGVNRYDLAVARRRLEALAARAIERLLALSPTLDYPGLVLAMGGDMVSGNIHDELTSTNQLNTMPTIIDLFGALAGMIAALAARFKNLFIPCVTGNHGRDTDRLWHKDRHHTSFDWLLYCVLAKHFEKDARVAFLIPDGPDAYWRVYDHRYLMTHGDQFAGGDGVLGALSPILRGDHKKRTRNAQIAMDYDTILLGHWHQYLHLPRLIVNGSLKGYDEYAYANNIPFERPQQALWLTHPADGITQRLPILVDDAKAAKACWVSVDERGRMRRPLRRA